MGRATVRTLTFMGSYWGVWAELRCNLTSCLSKHCFAWHIEQKLGNGWEAVIVIQLDRCGSNNNVAGFCIYFESQVIRISWLIGWQLWREWHIYNEIACMRALSEPRERKIAEFWGWRHTKFSTQVFGNTGLLFDCNNSFREKLRLISSTLTCNLIGCLFA